MYKIVLLLVASATLVASIEASSISLDPVVISATKMEQTLKETTANTTVITSEQLEMHHLTSIIDALRIFTSIPIAQSGGIGQQSSFYQQGFNPQNTVILVDGIRYNDPTTIGGQGQLEHLMVSDIERIEIINGPQSGVWGANASAGVINIITKQATSSLSINALGEYGTYNSSKLGANISKKNDSFSYLFGITQTKTDGISAQTPNLQNPKSFENDPYKNTTINTKINKFLSANDLIKLTLTHINSTVNYDAYNQPNSTANIVDQTNTLGQISYLHTQNNSTITFNHSISIFDKKDPLGWTTHFQGTNRETSLNANTEYSEGSSILLGINELTSKDTIVVKELISKGIYIINNNHFGNLFLHETLRKDFYSQFDDKITGKLGFKYFFTQNFAFSGNYGTGYLTPSLYNLFNSSYGNQYLQPEETKGYDTSLQYKSITIRYFDNTVNNLIDFNQAYQYVNISGQSSFKGYEALYSNQIHQDIVLNLAYNKLFAKDKNGNYLAKRPRETLKATTIYTFSPKLDIVGSAQYIGTRNESSTQTGRYTLWNLALNYELSGKSSLYIKGENLTDKLYQEVNGYGTPGRTITIGYKANF